MNIAINARIKDLEAKAGNKELSNSVRYKSRRDADILRVFDELGVEEDGGDLSEESKETLQRLVDPETYEPLVVSEGDNIMKVLEDNQDRRDIMGKVTKAAEKAGLKLDFASGKIVKA
jgi:hypothetical protein